VKLCDDAIEAILDGIEQDDTVADLTYLGLNPRIVQAIEKSLGVIFIQDLMQVPYETLLDVKNLGPAECRRIIIALNNYHLLGKAKKRFSDEATRRAKICRSCPDFGTTEVRCSDHLATCLLFQDYEKNNSDDDPFRVTLNTATEVVV
jgi:hypothetical protein